VTASGSRPHTVWVALGMVTAVEVVPASPFHDLGFPEDPWQVAVVLPDHRPALHEAVAAAVKASPYDQLAPPLVEVSAQQLALHEAVAVAAAVKASPYHQLAPPLVEVLAEQALEDRGATQEALLVVHLVI